MGYEFTTKDGYAHIRFTGQLTVEDLSAVAGCLDELGSTAESSPHRLMDISGVEDISLNFAALQKFTEKRSAVKPRNRVRLAIVARTPVQFGCARMFQQLSKQPRVKVDVFRELDSALQWMLGETEEVDRAI